MKILVFGAGANGKACQAYIEKFTQDELIGFLDNDPHKTSGERYGGGVFVYRPEEAERLPYDQILISNGRPAQIAEIKRQLDELRVPGEKVRVMLEDSDLAVKILSHYNQYDELSDSRVSWLRSFANYAKEEKLSGSVAECGVCMGEFSYFINKYFSDRMLYLFDTFSGFDDRDLQIECSQGHEEFLKSKYNDKELFSAGNEKVTLSRMLHPEKCVLRKGYFPETAAGIEGPFCFVNLDMDLYQPMLAGLRFFYEKMCPGGVILLHDYFNLELPGVREAVKSFEKEIGHTLSKMPNGDGCSMAVVVP